MMERARDALKRAWREDQARAQSGAPLWIIALSGGCDSRVLLHLCDELARECPLTLVTAHAHHGLRQSAEGDARFCARLAHRTPSVTLHHEVKLQLSKRGARSTQMAARRQRSAWLLELALELGAEAVLTGHHLNDAVETALLNARRGSGSLGLATLRSERGEVPLWIPGHEAIPTCRPLYDSTRREIEAFARARDLDWVEDPTNSSRDYERNAVRQDFVSQLSQGELERYASTLDTLAEEADFIAGQLETLRQVSVRAGRPWPGACSISIEALERAPRLLRRRLYLLVHRQRFGREAKTPARQELDAIDALRSGGHGVVALSGGVVVRDGEELLWLARREPGRTAWYERPVWALRLDLRGHSGSMGWLDGEVRWREAPGAPTPAQRAASTWCELPQGREALWVRGARPGDTITAWRGDGAPRQERVVEVLRRLGISPWRRAFWPCLVERREGGEERVVACGAHSSCVLAKAAEGEATRWIEVGFWRVRLQGDGAKK